MKRLLPFVQRFQRPARLLVAARAWTITPVVQARIAPIRIGGPDVLAAGQRVHTQQHIQAGSDAHAHHAHRIISRELLRHRR